MNSTKKYIKKKNNTKLLIWFGSVVILATAFILYRTFTGYNYKIIDYFYETNARQKFVFMFVEVNRLDEEKIKSSAKDIVKNHIVLINNDSVLKAGVLIYFYRKADALPVPQRMHNSLIRSFSSQQNVERNLRYIPEGYIYMKFGAGGNSKFLKDTLLKSDIIVPREGVRAKDVMRRARS